VLTVYLMGGMGNQMFQYAMGLAQARRLGVELQLDTAWFRTQWYRNIWHRKLPRRQYCLSLWRGVSQPLVKGVVPTVQYLGLPYDQSVVDRIKDGDCLKGYWATEKYFQGIRQELLGVFCPKQPRTRRACDLMEKISKEGRRSAFLTVRRGDYLTSDFEVLPMEYYLTACNKVAEHTPDPHFFVFSDDPGWCKNNFSIPYRCTIAEGNDQSTGTHLGREDDDLWLMRSCHHAVLANSTYSWWGAWLSPIPDHDRVVVAPKRWYSNNPQDTRDIVPDRWAKL
jgi:hypothetical protein